MELGTAQNRFRPGGLMGRNTHTYAIEYVAKQIGENLELLEEIASNSDNIDYGEMINVVTGPNKAITAFTSAAGTPWVSAAVLITVSYTLFWRIRWW